MRPLNANPHVQLVGLEELSGKANYFIGSDRKNWLRNVPTYARVQYRDLYPGIDVVFYASQGQLEYDVVVAPGADPRRIRFAFEEGDPSQHQPVLKIDEDGNLVLGLSSDRILSRAPRVVLRQRTGVERPIRGEYALVGPNEIGFNLPSYTLDGTLVIDPVLSYATFLGGSHNDAGFGIAVDADHNIYVTGATNSADFPVREGFQGPPPTGMDVFVTKLSATTGASLYSTYLGGNGVFDQGFAVALDAHGNAHVTGSTDSTDFPVTTDALQSVYGGGRFDAFLLKLSASGDMAYSTYLGAGGVDIATGIALDREGNVYIAGFTDSTNFPAMGALQSTYAGGSFDAFLTKLTADGSSPSYSTYLGGTGGDDAGSVAVDEDGSAYVAGTTSSRDFPTTAGALQPRYGGGSFDAYITKVSADGRDLAYSTYLGGSREDRLGRHGIAVDSLGNAYVTGDTSSLDFPLAKAFQRPNVGGSVGAFVAKLTAAGDALLYSTYLGGTGELGDFGSAIGVDVKGNAYVTGLTFSADFPTENAIQGTINGCCDAFVAKLNHLGTGLVYSTYLGGQDLETGHAIAVDDAGIAYVTGETFSSDFPTVNPFQPEYGGSIDAFVASIAELQVSCVGDCDHNGSVTVNEILTGVTIALGAVEFTACLDFDPNHDGFVTVDEILTAVNAALSNCPSAPR